MHPRTLSLWRGYKVASGIPTSVPTLAWGHLVCSLVVVPGAIIRVINRDPIRIPPIQMSRAGKKTSYYDENHLERWFSWEQLRRFQNNSVDSPTRPGHHPPHETAAPLRNNPQGKAAMIPSCGQHAM